MANLGGINIRIVDTVTGKKAVAWTGVNWSPGENTVTEVLQNVFVIVNTPIRSQVLNRRFGAYQNYVDKPMNVGLALVRFCWTAAIMAWEPRFTVSSITFDGSDALNGVVNCTINGAVNVDTANPYANVLQNASISSSPIVFAPNGT
jgi:phage baseplate assembly protein W